jgi:hypothetical protein
MSADEALMSGQPEPDDKVAAVEGERERSTIAFTYGDMEWAVKVAKSVHQVGGTSCQWDQLAAHLSLAAKLAS